MGTCRLSGRISPIGKVNGSITPIGRVSGSLSGAPGGGSYYEGPYEVIPATQGQNLGTANKIMREDVLIHEIPYAEVSNQYGTTATIAS